MARFTDQQWDDFYQLSLRLVEICQAEVSIRDEVPKTLVQAMTNFTSSMSGVLIAMLVLCNLLYFPYIIGRLNKSAKCNRSLLMLLPQDVLSGVKVLKDMMSAFTKQLL